MADNINLGAPRVRPGPNSLATAFATQAERTEAAAKCLSDEYEHIEIMIDVLDRSQLLDHADDWDSVRLGAAMFMIIADKVKSVRAALSAIDCAEIANVDPALSA